jgi:hypothetical protein
MEQDGTRSAVFCYKIKIYTCKRMEVACKILLAHVVVLIHRRRLSNGTK